MRSPLADLARPGRDLAGLVLNRASSVVGARRRSWGTKLNTAHGMPWTARVSELKLFYLDTRNRGG